MPEKHVDRLELKTSSIRRNTFDVINIYGPWKENQKEEGRVEPTPKVDGHFIIVYREFHELERDSIHHLGIAHSENELEHKVYSCARDYLQKQAKARGIKFVDLVAPS